MLNANKNTKQGGGIEWSWGSNSKALFLGWVSKEDLFEVVDSELMTRSQSCEDLGLGLCVDR